MSKQFLIVAAAIFITATVVGGTVGTNARHFNAPAKGARASNADRIEDDYRNAIEVVSSNYAGEVDYEKATQSSIQGMLSTLDPHSMYFTRNEFRKLKEDQDSRFYGIGVTILQHRDGVYVQSAVKGTPAERAGLRYGDRIVEVDGKDAREWTGEQVSKNVRGDRGEPVRVKVERAGASEPMTFTIVRDAVPLPSINNTFMIRPGVGYIGLTRGFQHTTGEELGEAVKNLRAQGMRQLVFDLRNNPGGLLDQAIDVASEFLPRVSPM
jgi:carboxyl-terminal processing protease